ncbi:thiol oxidoreductase [Microvirga sp. ACRRW]|uniref:di-heme oxidoredictase family protein n=1 Tax=Microvirga sp. ACRRW TaxID=2918205 RepID=UPI001EF4D44D|nr:di-heme oxidoredictase family protein [Microvirga sp. ACRRW]MCG7391632.1 thiol oxidoreductase [Microvirga sp. ACRRW]
MRLAVGIGIAILLAGTALADDRMSRAIGKALFERAWVPAPSSTKANDGLGPLFNARACVSCHVGLERMPVEVDAAGIVTSDNLVMRFSSENGEADPIYGRQLQTAAVPGLAPEGRIAFSESGPSPHSLNQGILAPGSRHGARLAPALRGMGLLDAVTDAAILERADPDDRNGDGISGRANVVAVHDGISRIGRFGWKASAATLSGMSATAFALDLGFSTQGRMTPWGDCTEKQAECRAAPHGADGSEPEITLEIVAMIRDYLASVAPPAPASGGTEKLGSKLFASIGCAACHAPVLPSPSGPVQAYTDLLLHDMGAGLDGGATEPGVASTEWRTAPLWGLSRILASGARFLHDGRAGTIEEAILAHGGEGSAARTRYIALERRERERLLAFLASL